MAERLTLGFDTSAAHCAAALLSGDRVLAMRHEAMDRGQAERLMDLLAETLAEAGADWRALDRIGVGTGPGNFTGIRISVSAARGLALGLGIPAIGVPVPDALALGTDGPVVTSVDAKGGRLCVMVDGQHVLCPRDDLPALPGGATCIGVDAEALALRCGGHTADPAYPLAEAIARIAAVAADTAPRPAPLYLRNADARPSRPVPPLAAG